jgi:hypothetical protein
MFDSMPEGGTTTVKSGKYGPYNQTKREAKTRWVLNPGEEGVPQVVVDLVTYHSAEGKYFFSSLTWGTVEPAEPGSVFMVETWASDHLMKRLPTVPVARYSVKALEAAHEAALAAMADRFSHFAPVFEQAAERNGLGEYAEADEHPYAEEGHLAAGDGSAQRYFTENAL